MATLRFHWDFFGPDASPTAAHFVKHLEEFCTREGIAQRRSWVSTATNGCTASLECEEAHMTLIRDRLRPKRAERVG